jgi:predicted secreted hydrolase
MTLKASAPDGAVELVLRPSSPILYGGGVGFYPLYDAITYQYSMGGIPTAGTVELDGVSVAVTGTTWYDRQWFKGPLPGGPLTWFGLCLDNGENLSIFDVPPNGTSWVTAVHPDGSQTQSEIAPLAQSESGEVEVAETGNVYPQRWVVKIPILEAELELTQAPMHENKYLYTGSVAVRGTYRGKPIEGFGFIDIPPIYGQE